MRSRNAAADPYEELPHYLERYPVRSDAETARLESEVEAGNPLAMSKLYPPTDPRHWEGIQKYELERCDDMGIESNYHVNEISVYEPMFPELVAESILRLGIIRAGTPNFNPSGATVRRGRTAIPNK